MLLYLPPGLTLKILQFCSTHWSFVLHMILAMHTDCFPVHHKNACISNGNILLSVWGTVWILCCMRCKLRRMRWAGHVARMGEERGVYRFLLGKPEGRRPLGRPRRRWVDNITMDLQEVGCGYMDWTGLAQDRDRWRTLVSELMNLRVPWNAGNFLTSLKPVSFWGRTLHHGVSKYGVNEL